MLDKSKLSPLSSDGERRNFSPQEIAKFNRLADTWWDPNGQYKTALLFNKARLSYFLPQICQHFGRDINAPLPLKGIRILDVGSGGGLVCEPLAQAGASVVGIDASEMSVEVARKHAASQGIEIEYRHALSSHLVAENQHFDVVINAEVVEHVPDQKALIDECCHLTHQDGLLILATLNRTVKSWLIAIVGAEYIMRYLPKGTHDWNMFVTPLELGKIANANEFTLVSTTGMKYNLLRKQWYLSEDDSVNYIQCYRKT